MYKKANRLKLKFQTSKGELTIEQLWTLKPETLKGLIIEQYNKIQPTGGELAFLEEKPVNEVEQLRYDILKDIYTTKITEAKESIAAEERKRQLNILLAAKARRQQADIDAMSMEELDAEIAKLNGK